MGRELDRSKGAGKTHDAERDPGHYINLADNGAVMGAAARAPRGVRHAAACERLHAVQGRLPVLFDRRRLAANPEGLRLLARLEEGHRNGNREFVKANLSRSAVAAGVRAFEACNCTIEDLTRLLLQASVAQVEALYGIEKEGGFKKGDPRGAAFATERLAVGATFARDMIVEAWLDSANTPVGYPMVNVRDIESGKVRVTRALFGVD